VWLYHVERETEEMITPEAGVAENRFKFKLPRSGHFVAKVRACEEKLCGEFAESTDPAVASVDGESRGWWVYGHLAPVDQQYIQILREP
jgi:hypothetical protein